MLSQCLANETGVRRWFHALNEDQRRAFNALYSAFADNVKKRGSEGWSHGWLGNFWTHVRNDFASEGVAGLWSQAPTWADSRTKLVKEAIPAEEREHERAQAALAAAPGNARLVRNEALSAQRLEDLRELAKQKAGACSDWAMDSRDALTTVSQDQFDIKIEVLTLTAILGDSGAHMIAKACPKTGGACIALDPWKRGYPELTTAEEWPKGPSAANSCFSVNKPVD